MMILENNILLPAISVLAATTFVVGCIRVRARMHRERAEDLRIAYRALKDFYRSVDKVVTDPGLNDDWKLLLLSMSEAISDRDAARYIVEEMTKNAFSKGRDNGEDARALAKARPDLAEEVVRAFKSGMIAMILRWPETASRFKEASAVLVDERAEIAAVKKVSKFTSEHRRDNIPNGALTA